MERFRRDSRRGFTLIELLMSMGIIGTISAIVITAINPTRQFAIVADAKRSYRVNQIQKAADQYLIKYDEIPGDTAIPQGQSNAIDICRGGKRATNCVNLDALVPAFVACLPYDGVQSGTLLTGFRVYQQVGRARVYSVFQGTNRADPGGGCEAPPDPVAHWKFDEPDLTGSAVDTMGSHDGTYTNIASPEGPSTDVPTVRFTNPYSLQLDGGDDFVTLAHHNDFNLTTAWTVTAWAKFQSFGSADNVDAIMRKGEGNPNTWQLAVEDGQLTMMLDGGDGLGGEAQGSTNLSANRWYHLAGTWDGTNARLYVNGVLDDAATHVGPILTDTRNVNIGGRATTDTLDGWIDDVRIYNVALGSGYILNLANGNP